MTKVEKLLNQCIKLETESNKLYDQSVKYLEDGNEMEWEDCLTRSIEKEHHAAGIRDALKYLGLIE